MRRAGDPSRARLAPHCRPPGMNPAARWQEINSGPSARFFGAWRLCMRCQFSLPARLASAALFLLR